MVDIEHSRFRPDARASVLISHQILQEEAEAEKFEAAMGVKTDAEDSASEVDDAEDLENMSQKLVPELEKKTIELVNYEEYEMHRLSGATHRIKNKEQYLCGRIRSENYLAAEQTTLLGCNLCEQCKSNMNRQSR